MEKATQYWGPDATDQPPAYNKPSELTNVTVVPSGTGFTDLFYCNPQSRRINSSIYIFFASGWLGQAVLILTTFGVGRYKCILIFCLVAYVATIIVCGGWLKEAFNIFAVDGNREDEKATALSAKIEFYSVVAMLVIPIVVSFFSERRNKVKLVVAT